MTDADPRLSDPEFQALLDLAMVCDPWPLPGEHKSVVESFLLKESKARGYPDWIAAYHDMGWTSDDADA